MVEKSVRYRSIISGREISLTVVTKKVNFGMSESSRITRKKNQPGIFLDLHGVGNSGIGADRQRPVGRTRCRQDYSNRENPDQDSVLPG